jgi:DNA polymerase-4
MSEAVILHIDMDAFFASVEQRDDPRLRKLPIAVVGSHKRTVLVSPSYEARSYGVKTGMTKHEAKSICPDIVFVKADIDKYTRACRQILKIIYSFSPDIEVYSIDEFFLDISHTMHLFGEPDKVARQIKEKIYKGLGLSCSIGISHNRLLAKFASKRYKPGGVFWVKKHMLPDILDKLEPDDLWGIGKKTKERLSQMGINTLGDLRKYDILALKRVFGVNGPRLHLMASGIDDSLVVPVGREEEAKSMGHSMTFDKDTSDPDELNRYLLDLCDRVGRRLRRESLSARTVKLTIRYKDFTTFTKQKALESPTDDTKSLYHSALGILRAIRIRQPVRLLGVSAARLLPAGEEGSLFEESRRKYRLNRLLDQVNERFGDSAVSFASLLSQGKSPAHKKEPKRQGYVISPAWRPYGSRNY